MRRALVLLAALVALAVAVPPPPNCLIVSDSAINSVYATLALVALTCLLVLLYGVVWAWRQCCTRTVVLQGRLGGDF